MDPGRQRKMLEYIRTLVYNLSRHYPHKNTPNGRKTDRICEILKRVHKELDLVINNSNEPFTMDRQEAIDFQAAEDLRATKELLQAKKEILQVEKKLHAAKKRQAAKDLQAVKVLQIAKELQDAEECLKLKRAELVEAMDLEN